MTADVEIGVWVDGAQKWVSGVTRRTTCQDIIKALLRAQNLRVEDNDVVRYVIIERWRKVERPLDHEQRILKVWRTWGDAVQEVRFSLRQVKTEGGDQDCSSSICGTRTCSGKSERIRRKHYKLRHYHSTAKETTVHTKKSAKDEARFSDTMERLVRLVVAQGETIQAQLRRIQERENQIDQYEQQMHLLRVQNSGTDYLLHSYLHEDPKDDAGSEEKSNDSGVVTEEHHEADKRDEEELPVLIPPPDDLPELEEIRTRVTLLERMEEIMIKLIQEEEALIGLTKALEATRQQHQDETEALLEEIARVADMHAHLVADVRLNEQRLTELDAVVWQRKKFMDTLQQEEIDCEVETRSLQAHLEYIIHLPPTAFRLPEEVEEPIPPPLEFLHNSHTEEELPINSLTQIQEENEDEDDSPPPLPSCPPPPLSTEEDEDDGDSANTSSSLCVSSRSSTSSDASEQQQPKPKGPPDSDSNSDTGLSSLHSDEGNYSLDTLV